MDKRLGNQRHNRIKKQFVMSTFFSDNEFSNLKIRNLNGLRIFTVDKHQFALPIWANLSISNDTRYSLVTFDFHTDTKLAFTNYAYLHYSGKTFKFRDVENFRESYIKTINCKDLETICKVTKNFAHDEHIQAALYFEYIHQPHIITVDQTHNDNDINYYITNNFYDLAPRKLVINPYGGKNKYLLKYRLNRLEDDYIKDTGFEIPLDPFILDFDLDYFPARDALDPQKNSIIKELVSNAQIITIAREKTFFENNCEQKRFSAQEAELLLIELIETLLNNGHKN